MEKLIENMSITLAAKRMKRESAKLAGMTSEEKNRILQAVRKALVQKKEEIFSANAKDLKSAEEKGLSPAIMARLKFDDHKLSSCVEGIRDLEELKDPVGETFLCRELDEGLVLKKISVPIGVIGVIFEARPDAMIQIASLCIKSANCAVLKGGSETSATNRALFRVIYDAAVGAGLLPDALFLAESHAQIDELLGCDKYIDLLIPRGSGSFVSYIMSHTKIPVMGHSAGICHIYVDRDADISLAADICVDAKTQYPAACNAAETLLLDTALPECDAEKIFKALEDAGTELFFSKKAAEVFGRTWCGKSDAELFSTEYSAKKMSVGLADGVEAACAHIGEYGSHHTDCIITENDRTADIFLAMVDSAGVYRNCSTRFADGFRYGFGAEVGISTGKLHARGPVGLSGLCTYKYVLTGSGHTVGEYAMGKRSFHFRDL